MIERRGLTFRKRTFFFTALNVGRDKVRIFPETGYSRIEVVGVRGLYNCSPINGAALCFFDGAGVSMVELVILIFCVAGC